MVKNFKTVAIISPSEGFIVKGIETKLEEIGFEYTFSLDTIDSISMIKNVADVFVLYLQDEMDTETLVYIKDMLSELNKRIIIVGEPIEFTKVEKVITESLVFKWLDRPLDMNLFLRSVELCAFEDIQPTVKKTILIVDDDIFYMRMVYDWLKDDYRIGMASSGLQAIKWLAKNKPDLILLDINMPGMDGYETITKLRAEETEIADIPVVFNVMLLSENYDDLDGIISLATDLGVEYRVSMSLIYRNDGSDSPMGHFIGDKEKIKNVLRTIRSKVYSVDRPIENKQEQSEFMCGAGVTSMCLSPDGTVFPCVSLKTPLGNINSSTVSEIWSGDARRSIVSSLRWDNTKECNSCPKQSNCPHCAGMSQAESGDMFACNTCDKLIAECISEL